MKKILISTSILAFLILGCGSSDSDDNKKETIDSSLKIGDVAYQAPSGIDFGNKMRTNLNKVHRKISNKISPLSLEKIESDYCSFSGTISTEESDVETKITFNRCIQYNEDTDLYWYANGILSINSDGTRIVTKQYEYVPDTYSYPTTGTYMNFTIDSSSNETTSELIIDGEMKEYVDGYVSEDKTFDRLMLKEKSSNSAMYISGGYSYKSGCLNQLTTFDTKEWLVPNDMNSDEYISGVIVVNSKRYSYNGSQVTVQYDNREGTFEQSELNAEIKSQENSNECQSTPYSLKRESSS